MRALNRTWQQIEREGETGAGPADRDTAEAVRQARERVWVADTACYYAHRRFQQSRGAADREAWAMRRRECEAAVEALRQAERQAGE